MLSNHLEWKNCPFWKHSSCGRRDVTDNYSLYYIYQGLVTLMRLELYRNCSQVIEYRAKNTYVCLYRRKQPLWILV